MSGKLIMKRKLDKAHHQPSQKVENGENETYASSMDNNINQNNMDNHKNDDASSIVQPEIKRLRCDTPPPEPEDLSLRNLPPATDRNRHLLEAIQSKMLELQNELAEFENDVEAHDDNDYYYDDQDDIPESPGISEQDAEALGFAMCAQETMVFLQREGVPSDSLLYTRLREALVGRSQPDRVLQL